MLPRANRFSFKGSVPKRVIQTPFITIRYQKIESDLKGAIVISKKASKKATDRNRMKRILSEKLFHHKNAPYSIVLFVKKNAFIAPRPELDKSITETLNSLLQ